MLDINTNLSSLIVQKNLGKSTNLLNQAIERMSTGYKINHASDNAANYSISTDLTTEIGAYSVAQDNISMGLDMVTTASDSLSLISDHAKRLRDLCMQAQNGTYGKQSIQAIQSEANARISEIVRLYNTAEYNGINLLNKVGSMIAQQTSEVSSGVGLEHDITPKANGFIDDIDVITPDVIVTDPTQLASAIANNSTIGIANAETLAKLAELVNSGTTCSGKTITLTEDIDLSAYSTGEGWTPIGNIYTEEGTVYRAFSGIFDGQGYKIKNLYINRPDANYYQALFGYAYSELKNVGLENCNVTGSESVAALAGYSNQAVITNCYATGSVTGNTFVGSLVGNSQNTVITNCYATGNVTGQSKQVGGLTGLSHGAITNCYATGNVSGNNRCAGGLVGYAYMDASITNCISYAENVTGTSSVGSFCGFTEDGYCDILNCQTTQIEGLNKVGTTDAFDDEISYLDFSTTLQVGINSDDSCQITFGTDFSYGLISSLKTLDVTKSSSLEFLDNFLAKASEKQTELGAVQNRLESALESASVSLENLTKTRSTIKDADIAEVSSDYIKQQILQQASATLLATTNQSTGVALTLLGGIKKRTK